jgi:hypothetical protein
LLQKQGWDGQSGFGKKLQPTVEHEVSESTPTLIEADATGISLQLPCGCEERKANQLLNPLPLRTR